MEIHYGFVDDAPNWRSRSGSGPSSSPQAPEPFDAVMTGPTPSGDSILRSTPESSGELGTTAFQGLQDSKYGNSGTCIFESSRSEAD